MVKATDLYTKIEMGQGYEGGGGWGGDVYGIFSLSARA